MKLSEVSKKISSFIINRIIEILGLIIILIGIFLFLSLITHAPDDPNFIFPDNTNIKNLFGFYGSFISDLFLQSFGLISFLLGITFIFTGIVIIKNKKLNYILRNILYSIFYIVFGMKSP